MIFQLHYGLCLCSSMNFPFAELGLETSSVYSYWIVFCCELVLLTLHLVHCYGQERRKENGVEVGSPPVSNWAWPLQGSAASTVAAVPLFSSAASSGFSTTPTTTFSPLLPSTTSRHAPPNNHPQSYYYYKS